MNFEVLKQEIEDATKKAFLEINDKHGDEEIYAFALYSDEDAITVCPSTNTLKHLSNADPEDIPYYKFEPAEWKYEMKGADKEFSNISKQLYNEVVGRDIEEDVLSDFRKQLFDTCIDVLEKLKNENFFKQVVGKDIFLTFTVSDYDFDNDDLKNIVSRLNDNEYKTEYLNWMKTWA